MTTTTRSLSLAIALLAATLATGAAADPQKNPKPVATKLVPSPPGLARPALWKVADSDTTIYLFGTIHALPDGISWMEGPVAKAFNGSQLLVTEIPETPPAVLQGVVMNTALLPKGKSLRAMMTKKDAALLEKTLKGFGLPGAALDQYEPWFAAITLATLPLAKSGYTAANGVEAQLTTKAKAANRPMEGLETAAQQLGIFDSLPQKTQLRYLHEVMTTLPDMSKQLSALVKYWSVGNPDKLALLMNADEDDPQMMKALLFDRNRNWADWIQQRMAKPGAVFIAVGAGHLAGGQSVQAMLAKQGLRVTRLQ